MKETAPVFGDDGVGKAICQLIKETAPVFGDDGVRKERVMELEAFCLILYFAAYIFLLVQIRRLDVMEQRERQLRVTRRRWLWRRIIYAGLMAVLSASLLIPSAGIFGIGESDRSSPDMWVSVAVAVFGVVILYYLLTATGKIFFVYIGWMLLIFCLGVFLGKFLQLLASARNPVLLLAVEILVCLLLFFLYRHRFFRRDLRED